MLEVSKMEGFYVAAELDNEFLRKNKDNLDLILEVLYSELDAIKANAKDYVLKYLSTLE